MRVCCVFGVCGCGCDDCVMRCCRGVVMFLVCMVVVDLYDDGCGMLYGGWEFPVC